MKKKPSQNSSECAKNLQTVPPPDFVIIPPLSRSLLTQPARQNRARLHLPENPQTRRQALQDIRKAWIDRRLQMNLTAEGLREHLATNLRDVPLEEDIRRHVLTLCQHAPDDPVFWWVIQDALEHVWPRSLRTDDTSIWNGAYFRERFAEQHDPVPAGWVAAASNVLDALFVLKTAAFVQINQRSRVLFSMYQKGRVRGNYRALVAAAQEWLPAPWVEQEKFVLRQQVLKGTPEEQDRAKTVLAEIAEHETDWVSGRQKTLFPEERKAIVADCKKWKPICEGLNNAFKGKDGLWEQPEYESSELHRKEARGRLAEKHRISIADVQAIEAYLEKPSHRSNKSTPPQAMYRRVAREHGRAETTVKKIWEDYLKDHPEESKKKRKLLPP